MQRLWLILPALAGTLAASPARAQEVGPPPLEIGELDGRDRPRHTAIFVRVQALLAWIDQHAVAVDVALIVG